MSSPVHGLRIAVIYNTDFASCERENGDEPPSYAADAEVAETAHHVCGALRDVGADAFPMPISSSLAGLVGRLRRQRTDLVFNLVESLGNEASREWQLPALLERYRVPYTGNAPRTLRASFAKEQAHAILSRAGVRVPRALAVKSVAELDQALAKGPVPETSFVKPARADGSIGIDQGSIVRDREALRARVEWLTRHLAGPCLVEEYLPGPEINVAVFPDPRDGWLVPTEIDFTGFPADYAPIVTYECKWVPGGPESTAFSRPCTSLGPAERDEVLEIARRALFAVQATGYGRVDLRFDAQGRPAVIDVNPNPDLHPDAGLAIAAATVGLGYSELVSQIASHALRTPIGVAAGQS